MRKAQNCGQLLKVTNPAKLTKSNELFQKRLSKHRWKNGGSWGHGLSRVIEERACGNSRRKKQELEFPGVFTKDSLWNVRKVSFLVFELEVSTKGCRHTVLQIFQGWNLVFCKKADLKIAGFFQKSIYTVRQDILNLPIYIFSGIPDFGVSSAIMLFRKYLP